MYRRLVTFALIVVTVAVTTLVIPLALSARDLARAGNLSELSDQARGYADSWEAAATRAAGSDDVHDVPAVEVPGEPGDVVLVHPDGQVIGGPVPPQAQGVVDVALSGASASVDTGSAGYAAAPAVFGESGIGAVLVSATSEQLNEGLRPRLAALAALCVVLLCGAGIGAWVLARRTVRPILDLATAAEAIARGDLAVRVSPSAIAEVDDVGVALNRLAARVQELLAEERASAAELAHQLRTPLTVLAADVDAVADPEVRERLEDDVQTLKRTTDEIITSVRRIDREGLHASCDAVAVLADRVTFWRVLADFQGREFAVELPTGPQPVRLTEYDLTTAVDILLQNVFTHTEEGVGLRVALAPTGPGVEVVVEDAGPGFPEHPRSGPRTGSTSLGLAIAERIAVASGGTLRRGAGHLGGARVTLRLGRPS